MAEQTILIAEDDADIRDGVRILLAGEGYRILEAENGPEALKLFSSEVDLVILDVMMPGMSGLRVCEELRKISTVPILFLTAKSQESDKLLGLTAGGDDYLAKPFSFAELSARVKALLRRYCVYQGKAKPDAAPAAKRLCAHGVQLELDCNRVWVDGREVNLTETEYKILRLLMQNPQRIFPVQTLYELVWNEPYIRRILDNITSNILKYADPAYPVSVTFVREEDDAGLAFANVTLSDTDSVESTKVGLVSIQTMMEKMHADSRAESDGRRFCITLLFPVNS